MKNLKKLQIYNGPAPTDQPVKFWSMSTTGDDDAEITMYGEIVSRRPMDWWTGEPAAGLYISPEEFLEDLSQIKAKSNITIRLNSVGGDLYTGMAIYTQLKGLPGNKTVIIDGMAASAASIIAMSGDTIKIPAGGMMMIHDPSAFLYDNYNPKALKEVMKMLDNAAAASAEVYAAKTGLAVDAIRTLMSKETWMTGRDAVDKGFADEILYDNDPQMVMMADKSEMIVNGIHLNLKGFHNIPGTIPVKNSAKPSAPAAIATEQPKDNANKLNSKSGGEKKMNLEELKSQHPDLVKEIIKEAVAAAKPQAVADERARLQAIEEIEATVGDKELIQEAKFGDKACTAQELAFNAMKKQAKLGTEHLDNTAADAKASGAANVTATPNAGTAPAEKDEAEEVKEIAGIFNKIMNGGKK